jgi:hypothetical protein
MKSVPCDPARLGPIILVAGLDPQQATKSVTAGRHLKAVAEHDNVTAGRHPKAVAEHDSRVGGARTPLATSGGGGQ